MLFKYKVLFLTALAFCGVELTMFELLIKALLGNYHLHAVKPTIML